jgi:hypothetical protein
MAWHTDERLRGQGPVHAELCGLPHFRLRMRKVRVRSPERHSMRIAWSDHNMRGTVFSLSGKCSGCTVVTRLGVVREPLRGRTLR